MITAVTIDIEVETLGERAVMLLYTTLPVLLNLLHLTSGTKKFLRSAVWKLKPHICTASAGVSQMDAV